MLIHGTYAASGGECDPERFNRLARRVWRTIVEADAAVTVRRIGRLSAAPDANPLLPLGFGQHADGTDDADGRVPTSGADVTRMIRRF